MHCISRPMQKELFCRHQGNRGRRATKKTTMSAVHEVAKTGRQPMEKTNLCHTPRNRINPRTTWRSLSLTPVLQSCGHLLIPKAWNALLVNPKMAHRICFPHRPLCYRIFSQRPLFFVFFCHPSLQSLCIALRSAIISVACLFLRQKGLFHLQSSALATQTLRSSQSLRIHAHCMIRRTLYSSAC